MSDNIPRKRGRPRKNAIKPPEENTEKKVKKKRGRKPKEIYDASKQNPEVKKDDNFILHIPKKIEKSIIIDEKDDPKPYQMGGDELHLDNIEEPNVTNKMCMWCCHGFYTQNWGIPYIYTNKVYKTYGNFCSPECCTAYCFDDISTTDDRKWEIYSMINDISRKIYNNNIIIKSAPPRISLKMFNGKYTIDEFRQLTNENKIAQVYLPPIIPILHNIEEHNEQLLECNTGNNIKTENFSINSNVVLKRDRPLRNEKNTLEHSMSLKFFEK